MLVAKTQARIAAVLISVLPCVATAQQSWLQGQRAEVWESATANTSDSSPPSQSADNPSQDHHHHDDSHVSWFSDDCDDDGLEDWFGETVAWVMLGSVTAPFWAPAGIMGDTWQWCNCCNVLLLIELVLPKFRPHPLGVFHGSCVPYYRTGT